MAYREDVISQGNNNNNDGRDPENPDPELAKKRLDEVNRKRGMGPLAETKEPRR